MSRQRRRKKKEKENNERWLITYSDLITLLMIFFVIMYAMSSINQIKFTTLSASLAAALHHSDQIPLQHTGTTALITAANSHNNGDKQNTGKSVNAHKRNQELDNLYSQVKKYIIQHHLQGSVTILNQTRGVQITLRDVALFNSGQATIKTQARNVIDGMVPFFQTLPNLIVIEGYTDNTPIDTPQFPSNWELSAARALGVVHLLVADQIAPQRLSAVAYGQYHPIVPNTTPQNRQENRRVNIVILRDPNVNAGTTNVAQ